MKEEVDQKELQQKYMEFQMMEQIIQQLQQQMQAIEQQMIELVGVKQNLADLKKAKKGSEILVPIANGIFVKGELKENDALVVNVGSNVAVNRTVAEADNMLERQFLQLQELQAGAMVELQKYSLKAQSLQEELAKLIED